jgi:hypothetical protein
MDFPPPPTARQGKFEGKRRFFMPKGERFEKQRPSTVPGPGAYRYSTRTLKRPVTKGTPFSVAYTTLGRSTVGR